MVYTPMSASRTAVAQSEIDEAFERVKRSGFLKSSKPLAEPRANTCVQQNGKTTKTVVVEKKARPRVTPEQRKQLLLAEEEQRKEKILAEARRKQEEAEAKRVLCDLMAPLRQRIAAAELLGFAVKLVGSEEEPRRVVLRHPNGERIVIEFPKGKNARRQMGHLRLR